MTKSISIITLSELERSPRVYNWCLAFAKAKYRVDLLNYSQTDEKEFSAFTLPQPPKILNQLPRFLQIITKALFMVLLYCILIPIYTTKSDFLVVMIPPFHPALLIVVIISAFRSQKLCLDWHNTPHSVISFEHGKGFLYYAQLLVERMVIYTANHLLGRNFINIAVTEKFKALLEQKYSARNVYTLEDYPCRRHQNFFGCDKWETRKKFLGDNSYDKLVLITSTSYTKDEPLEILVEALEKVASCNPNLKLVCVITGKGGLMDNFKKLYDDTIGRLYDLHQIWVANQQEYMELLSCCDLGLSFHCSTSGVDFPMKLIDMMSVGIPLCSVDYDVMRSISKAMNIRLFGNSSELSEIIGNTRICKKNNIYNGVFWEDLAIPLIKDLF